MENRKANRPFLHVNFFYTFATMFSASRLGHSLQESDYETGELSLVLAGRVEPRVEEHDQVARGCGCRLPRPCDRLDEPPHARIHAAERGDHFGLEPVEHDGVQGGAELVEEDVARRRRVGDRVRGRRRGLEDIVVLVHEKSLHGVVEIHE